MEEHDACHTPECAVPPLSASSLPGCTRGLTLESADGSKSVLRGVVLMRGRSWTRRLVALSALVVVVGACGNASSSPQSGSGGSASAQTTVDQPGVTKDTIRVGGVSSTTNALNAPYGDIFKGVKAYFAMVNSKGGIDGRKLEVTSERDDQMVNNLREVQALLNQDNVFAAVGMNTLIDFSAGSKALEAAGIPTFGWNINSDWNKSNLFGNSGALCIGCVGVEVPWMAKQLGKKTVGVLAYNVDNSKNCAEGVKKSFEKYPSAKVGFYSDSLSFGVTDFSVEVGQMKDAGVDFITTCMDTNGVLNLAKEARKQNLDAVQYLPNGYDQAFMKANGQFFEGSVVRVPFVPFETSPRPKGLDEYLTWMEKQGDTPNEYATYGWINAAMLVEGLRAAGPDFTRQKVVDALNKMTADTAGGMVPPIDWTTQHTDTQAPLGCAAYVKVVNKKFVAAFVPKGKVYLCFPNDANLDTKPVYK
jgi:ABC-type branched-subunit amino acid transport system substrate-binding protein